MITDRMFIAGCVGGMTGMLATCANHWPTMFKTRFEYDQLINEAMKLDLPPLPPSFKSIFVKNLSGIPTSLAVVTATSVSILGIRIVASDYFKKRDKSDTLQAVGSIATTVFTYYFTQSVGLSLINLGVSLLPFYAKQFDPLLFPILSPFVVSGTFAFLSRTLCSLYEVMSNDRNYSRNYTLLIKENKNKYLDFNDGAARKASEACFNLFRGFLVNGAKNLGFGIVSTTVGVSFGQIVAQNSGVKEAKKQNQIASICGVVAGGALSFYFTRSIGLSTINASICGLAPICFPKTY